MNNIGTILGDKTESKIADNLEDILPNKPSKNNKNDRGIYGDAILENYRVIIHENPKDLKKFINDAKERNIIIIDLILISADSAIKQISSI